MKEQSVKDPSTLSASTLSTSSLLVITAVSTCTSTSGIAGRVKDKIIYPTEGCFSVRLIKCLDQYPEVIKMHQAQCSLHR